MANKNRLGLGTMGMSIVKTLKALSKPFMLHWTQALLCSTPANFIWAARVSCWLDRH